MLTPAQHQSKLQSVSSVARKVLEAVPISEAWRSASIREELHRMTDSTIDAHTINGCLATLVKTGLVSELLDSLRP